MRSTSNPKVTKRQQLRVCSLSFLLPLVSFPVNEIRARFKEFGRTCLHKEFLRESEGSLQSERSMPKLHCCSSQSWRGIREIPQVVSGDVRDKLHTTAGHTHIIQDQKRDIEVQEVQRKLQICEGKVPFVNTFFHLTLLKHF